MLSENLGARLLCFSGPEAYPTSTADSILTWPRSTTKHRHDLHSTDQQSIIPNSITCLYNGGDKRFSFSNANYPERRKQTVPEVSPSHRLVNTSACPEIGRNHHQKTLSDRLTQCVNSKRARSLLSSHRTQALDVIHYPDQSTGIGLDNVALVQYSQSRAEEPPLLFPQESNGADLRNQVFQVAPDDLLEKRASQVLPFSWK